MEPIGHILKGQGPALRLHSSADIDGVSRPLIAETRRERVDGAAQAPAGVREIVAEQRPARTDLSKLDKCAEGAGRLARSEQSAGPKVDAILMRLAAVGRVIRPATRRADRGGLRGSPARRWRRRR